MAFTDLTRTYNEKLPLDILVIIWEDCLGMDGPSFPMETFLLVCKAWTTMALALPSLWSEYDISIESIRDLEFWIPCVGRRLLRCSHETLLDIHIFHRWSPAHNGINMSQEIRGVSLLSQLTGTQGEIARRWRRLGVTGSEIDSDLIRFLYFPTPLLEEFYAYGIISQQPILPETPILQTFHVGSLVVPSFPDLHNATDISIQLTSAADCFDSQAIARATKLKHLCIHSWCPYTLSGHFPQLQNLSLTGYLATEHERDKIICSSIREFSAPKLQEIELLFERGLDYIEVVQCAGIYMETLKEAYIGWPFRVEDEVEEHLEGLEQFLKAAVNLDVLSIRSESVASVIFKLLCDRCVDLFQHRPLMLRLFDAEELLHEAELGRGDQRFASINRFTECVEEFKELQGCLAEAAWRDVFIHVERALQY
jgi:hypothetical protein